MGDLNDTGNKDILLFGFEFERLIFVYVLPILVATTLTANVFVIYVFSQKGLRNNTTLLFIFIAVSDSFAAIVILPTSIAVYKDFLPTQNNTLNTTDTFFMSITISKTLCRSYWISSYLSRVFQFTSSWLTTYLGIQRYISVKYPFQRKVRFTKRNNIIVCAVTVLSALILHSVFLVKDTVTNGECVFRIEMPCYETCIYLLAKLLIDHISPCVLLTTTTVLLVRQLYVKETSVISHTQENRQVSKTVIMIAVVFLIQEVPHGLFVLGSFTKLAFDIPDVPINRIVIYFRIIDILMVLSFTANFFIYAIWNKRFRATLQNVLRCKVSSISNAFSSQPTGHVVPPRGHEMEMQPMGGQ